MKLGYKNRISKLDNLTEPVCVLVRKTAKAFQFSLV